MKQLNNHKGFTLVELAIVLVIIGILLGGVLKGQELINNSRLKRAYNLQRETTAAIYTYYDRYGKYPGDDNVAAGRWAGTTNGNSNGLIAGYTFTCAAAATTETCQLWRHLRNAGLITGNAASAENPSNPYGGGVAVGTATVQGLNAMWIGFDNVPRILSTPGPAV